MNGDKWLSVLYFSRCFMTIIKQTEEAKQILQFKKGEITSPDAKHFLLVRNPGNVITLSKLQTANITREE